MSNRKNNHTENTIVASSKFHFKLHAAFPLSIITPATIDWKHPATHVNIVAQYLEGKTLNNLTCGRCNIFHKYAKRNINKVK